KFVVTDEEQTRATPLVALGTPSSSRLVRAALEAGNLQLQKSLGSEGFAIHLPSEGGTPVVAALAPHGLGNGVGRLLRESRFANGRWVMPGPLKMSAAPQMRLRPIYLATHLGNWYCHASPQELRRYVEDLALWGYNALVTWFDFHHYR